MPIKMVFCLKRRSDLSREEFQRYWLEEHAPLVARLKDQTNMLRYVQSHTIESRVGQATAQPRGITLDYDGIMEGWWESEEAAKEAFRTHGPEAGRLMFEDERNFIDFSGSRMLVSNEQVIFDVTKK